MIHTPRRAVVRLLGLNKRAFGMAPQRNTRWPVLGRLSQQEFLKKYWQKRPVLLKGALVPFPDVITPEEVAGMSCDERVESRLIMEKGGKQPWELKRGPFKPSLFKKLPKTHWTILVNGVDRFIPKVNAFLDHFSFVPFWRMDDIMVSYADDKGNVGAHVDNFDVFLVQAAGKREWMIEDRPVLTDDFIPNLPVRLLKKFKPTHRWVLEPGDILYLPPRFPHHGIARGKGCMTISVGFRAPTTAEILNSVVSSALSQLEETARYSDPDLKVQAPGEISSSAIKKIAETIQQSLASEHFLSDWLGRFATEPYGDVDLDASAHPVTQSKVSKLVRDSSFIVRAEGSRLAYTTKSRTQISFFMNGERQELSGKAAECARLLADRVVVPVALVAPLLGDSKVQRLLVALLTTGAVILED
jgi:50S ribosomal protein L16 3-hydroxylase